MSLAAKDVDRGLRATLWPALRAEGFAVRTDRVAWRYAGDDVDIVELQAVGRHAEAIGCPSLSLSVFVAAYPAFLDRAPGIPLRDGRLRPHYWHCDPFRQPMRKTIPQPWFRPFSEPLDQRLPPSFRLHREALRRLVRRDAHDVPEIWYMRTDGTNLDANLSDLTGVVLSTGLELLDRYHDPEQVLASIEAGTLVNRGSPRARELTAIIETFMAAGHESAPTRPPS